MLVVAIDSGPHNNNNKCTRCAKLTGQMVTMSLVLTLLLLVASESVLLPSAAAHHDAPQSQSHPQQQQQQQQQQPKQLVQQDSLHLNAILQHQQALASECAQIKAQKQRELEYLLKYNHDNDQVELPHPIPIKVPAVCLLFLAEPVATQQPRLELVNWIFDEDDVRHRWTTRDATGAQHGHTNITKRQAPPQLADALDDYIFDPLAHPPAPNELDTDADSDAHKMAKFHQDVDALLADERFRSGMHVGRAKIAEHLSPVVLIPGLLGSRLQARTDKARRVNVFCSKQSDWQDMWLSLRLFLPIAVDCWLDNVRLEYDPSTGFTRQPDGVEARVADFGSVESVRHLDLRQPKLTTYYQPIIERYEQLGYTTDRNLLAAPYDFRLAPNQLGRYFGELRALIEWAQAESPSGKPVTLVCHSMGCTHALIFLRQQSAAWRQNRIRKLIALSSPWAGTAKALKALVVGDQLDLPLVSEAKMRRLARTYPAIAYLLPQTQVFAQANRNQVDVAGPVLVQTPSRQYRVADLEQLMRDLNLTRQFQWFQAAASLIRPDEPLVDVDVDCVYSENVPTPETLIFRNQTDFADGEYELVKGDGDGTVNLQSLAVCDQWARQLPQRVKTKVILNTNHLGVLKHKITLTHITDDVLMNK